MPFRRALAALGVAAFLVPVATSARPRPTPTPTGVPTATPSPAPTPLSGAARIANMHAALSAIANTAPGHLGVAVVDLTTHDVFSVAGDEPFALQSVFKLAVATAAFRRADARTLDLEARIPIERGDLRAASALTDSFVPGMTRRTWELLRAMLVTSDNTACDILLREVGGPQAVTALLRRLHIDGITIRKSEADMHADALAQRNFARGGDNPGTPNGVAALLAAIVTGRVARLDSTSEFVRDLTDVTTGADRLRAGLPSGARLLHKTGTGYDFDGAVDATNDAGVLTLPDGRRIVIVALMGSSRADAATRAETLARVARAVYAAYGPPET